MKPNVTANLIIIILQHDHQMSSERRARTLWCIWRWDAARAPGDEMLVLGRKLSASGRSKCHPLLVYHGHSLAITSSGRTWDPGHNTSISDSQHCRKIDEKQEDVIWTVYKCWSHKNTLSTLVQWSITSSTVKMSRRASFFARTHPGQRRVRFPDEIVFHEVVKESDGEEVIRMLRRVSVDIDINRITMSGMTAIHQV